MSLVYNSPKTGPPHVTVYRGRWEDQPLSYGGYDQQNIWPGGRNGGYYDIPPKTNGVPSNSGYSAYYTSSSGYAPGMLRYRWALGSSG